MKAEELNRHQLIAVAAHDTSTTVGICDLRLPMEEFYKVGEYWYDRVVEAKPIYQDRHAMREVFMHWMLDHGELVKNFVIPFDEWKHEMIYQIWWHVAFYTRPPEPERIKNDNVTEETCGSIGDVFFPTIKN
jgi:hypothetical protein